MNELHHGSLFTTIRRSRKFCIRAIDDVKGHDAGVKQVKVQLHFQHDENLFVIFFLFLDFELE